MDEKTIREEALKLLPSLLQLEVQRILREESAGMAIESVDQVLGADPEAISRVSSACVDYVVAIAEAAKKRKKAQETFLTTPAATTTSLGSTQSGRMSLADIARESIRQSLHVDTAIRHPLHEESLRSSYLGYLDTLNEGSAASLRSAMVGSFRNPVPMYSVAPPGFPNPD